MVVQLVEEKNPGEGVLQVYDAQLNIWRYICEEDLGEFAAEIACRQLGHRGAVVGK